MSRSLKSKAGHVLSTSEDADARSLAAHVLGEDAPAPVKSFEELQALLIKIEGVEGQHERAVAVRAEMERLGG